jgi:hypothetical protein
MLCAPRPVAIRNELKLNVSASLVCKNTAQSPIIIPLLARCVRREAYSFANKDVSGDQKAKCIICAVDDVLYEYDYLRTVRTNSTVRMYILVLGQIDI